ncbi:ABC transporter permease subunit [Kribbella sp. NPDC058245]|uniref:ABC transporter permease subunit n=1 Tax=Kribbella sp. NPDC058245 TaxID=3346399 RepID=UPI0036F13C4E
MIWLTWRQFRIQFLVIAAVVLAAAIALAATGPGLLDDYHQLAGDFIKNLGYERFNPLLYNAGLVLLYAAPPVIGAFWGAPLIARELEAGTHRLVWGQSISRTRWLATKLAVTGLSAVAITGLLSLAVTWWADPIDDALNAGQGSNTFLPRMFPVTFSARGLVPIGYAAFAFAFGVAAGLVIRRTLVALAVTLAVVILVQIVTPSLIRQHLITPTELNVVATQENVRGFMLTDVQGGDPRVKALEVTSASIGAWKMHDQTVDKSGAAISVLPEWAIKCGPEVPRGAANTPAEQQACYQRLADEGYHQNIKYLAADKFWPLQWREFGLFLLLAFGLVGFSFWRIRKDLS